jgi:hypothetical protein
MVVNILENAKQSKEVPMTHVNQSLTESEAGSFWCLHRRQKS